MTNTEKWETKYGVLKSKGQINLINNIREKIKQIDKNITENFRKYYISYSVGRCFLYIWLNKNKTWIYFKTDSEFNDRLKLCQSVPRGITQTFDKRAELSEKNLNYSISLVKQSYNLVVGKKDGGSKLEK